METNKISVLENFTEYPALRHCSISDYSGEEFYHKVLNDAFVKAYNSGAKLLVDLDGTAGYASSFLDEAFGNLIYDFSLKIVKGSVIIKSDQEPSWKEMIESQTYPQWEQRRIQQIKPEITTDHAPWYRIEDSNLIQKQWSSVKN